MLKQISSFWMVGESVNEWKITFKSKTYHSTNTEIMSSADVDSRHTRSMPIGRLIVCNPGWKEHMLKETRDATENI